MSNPYLGFRTYKESDSELFKGREDDIRNIYDYIINNSVTILYANSGIGKSSVINAGLCPILRSNNYFPIYIRCNEYSSTDTFDKLLIDVLSSSASLTKLWYGSDDNPVLLGGAADDNNREEQSSNNDGNKETKVEFKVRSIYEEKEEHSMFYQLDQALSKKSLWWFLRTREIYFEVAPGIEAVFTPLLIFDQFEEFFDKAGSFDVSGEFFKWYNRVFSQITPPDVQKAYNEISINYTQGQKFILNIDLKCKSLFSLRKEYIGQMDYWVYQYAETRNTSFLYNRYLLRPLQKKQAEQVIGLSDKLQSKKESILNYIGTKEHDGYPAIILSVVCDELLEEENAFETLLKGENVEHVLSLAYERAIKKSSLTSKEVEDLEKKLVDKNCKRIRRTKEDLKHFLANENKIEELLNCHILTSIGGGIYELIHDKIAVVVAERVNHARNRKKNSQKNKDKMNVLSVLGRQLIDNADDFGCFRTINNRSIRKPAQVALFMGLSASLNRNILRRSSTKSVNSLSLDDMLDEKTSNNAFTYIRFAEGDGDEVMTKDGIYQFKLKYQDDKIEEIYFYGQKIEQKLFTRGGFHGIRFKYTPSSQDNSYTETRYFLDDLGKVTNTIDGYAIVKYHFNEFGLLDEVRYFDKNEKPCNHADGNHGFISYYDEDGLEIKRIFVAFRKKGKFFSSINQQDKDEKDKLAPTKILSGVYGHTYIRDEKGRIIVESNIDRKGNICYDLDNYCTVKYKYDDKDRIIEESYYDKNDVLMPCNDGFSLIETRFDDNLHTCDDVYYLDTEKEQRVKHNDGYWKLHFVMDNNDRIKSFCFKDKNDSPFALTVIILTGTYYIYKEKFTLNDKGQVVSIRYDDIYGRQIAGSWVDYNKQGTQIIRLGNLSSSGNKEKILEYDCMALGISDDGKGCVQLFFLNDNNKPQICTGGSIPLYKGLFSLKLKYDEKGREISEKFYDIRGKRIPAVDNGVWGIGVIYNDLDRTRTLLFQKKEGVPYGFSFTKRVDHLNEKDEVVKSYFYNDKGEQTTGPDGTYSTRIYYSPDQSIKTIEFLDQDGGLMNNIEGYAIDIEKRVHINGEWRPTKKIRKNAKNKYVNNEDGDLITVYLYYQGGYIAEQVSLNIDEEPCINNNGYSIIRTTTELRDGIRGVKTEYLDNNRQLCNNIKGVSVIHREYDDYGRIIFEMRYDHKMCPIKNQDGTYGIRYVFGEKSKTTIYLDENSQWMISNDGYAKLVQEYDEKGRLSKEQYFDANGQRMPDKAGDYETIYSRVEYDMGRETTIISIGEDGKPHLNNFGWAYKTIVYDKEDYEISVKTFDDSMYPTCTFNEAYGYEIAYYDNHKKSTKKFLLPNNKPAKGPQGFAMIVLEKDELGRKLKECYFDENERPYQMKDGTYGKSFIYSDVNTSIETNLGFDENPSVDYEGVCYRQIVRDKEGRTIKELMFDINRRPFEDGRTNCGYEYQYDGEWTRLTGLDENFKPHYNEAGYCMKSYTKDDKGRVLVELFFDHGGNPIMHIMGVYGFCNYYDDEQNKRMVICLGRDGLPVMSKNGYAVEVRKLDDEENIVEEMWYDDKMQPIANALGDYGEATEYHDNGGRTIISLDRYHNPRMNSNGYSRIYILRDGRGRKLKEMWYDTNGIPIKDNYGDYGTAYIYGEQDNDITYESLDIDGNPHINIKGWAFNRRVTDDKGRVILDQKYDVHQNPIEDELGDCGTIMEYYDDENKTIEISLDENGQPHFNKYGYVKKVIYRDEKGRTVKERTLDVDDNPVPDTWGDCGTDYFYDDENNVKTMVSLNENEMPRINVKGWAFETKFYDERRRVIKRLQYDIEHRLIPDHNGNCGEITVFDDENKSHSLSMIGTDGSIRINSWGMATIVFIEDDDKRPIKYMYLNEVGDPVKNEDGNYGIGFEYDDNPQVRIRICLNEKGEPHECIHGFAYRKEILDEDDDITKYYRFNINKEPLVDFECRITYCGDENHTEIRTYYDVDGNEHNNVRGYHKEISFNDKNGQRKEIYFDIDGNVVTPKE